MDSNQPLHSGYNADNRSLSLIHGHPLPLKKHNRCIDSILRKKRDDDSSRRNYETTRQTNPSNVLPNLQCKHPVHPCSSAQNHPHARVYHLYQVSPTGAFLQYQPPDYVFSSEGPFALDYTRKIPKKIHPITPVPKPFSQKNSLTPDLVAVLIQ